jgi:arabinose-5-phosphate isomerase
MVSAIKTNLVARQQAFATALETFFIQWTHTEFTVFESLTARLANADTIHGTGSVYVTALGKSGLVANVFVAMLVSVGINARFIHPTEAFHGDFGMVSPGSCVVCISNNGNTAELLALIPFFKKKECVLFAITANPKSKLAKFCKNNLYIPAKPETCPMGHSPLLSTVTTLSLCQWLVGACIEARGSIFSVESYAMNHPGGSIGKKIFLTTKQLMHTTLPIVLQDASFIEVVSSITGGAKGVCIVQNNEDIAGIISEKDLRRAMMFGKTVFDQQAHTFMNPTPKTILDSTLAWEAAFIMKQRTPRLNYLVVLSAINPTKCVGLLFWDDLQEAGLT